MVFNDCSTFLSIIFSVWQILINFERKNISQNNQKSRNNKYLQLSLSNWTQKKRNLSLYELSLVFQLELDSR